MSVWHEANFARRPRSVRLPTGAKRLGIVGEETLEMKHRSVSASGTDDTTSLCLAIVIACLTGALLFVGLPPSNSVTANQINEMQLLGP